MQNPGNKTDKIVQKDGSEEENQPENRINQRKNFRGKLYHSIAVDHDISYPSALEIESDIGPVCQCHLKMSNPNRRPMYDQLDDLKLQIIDEEDLDINNKESKDADDKNTDPPVLEDSEY